jgi:CBS domain-containing protein
MSPTSVAGKAATPDQLPGADYLEAPVRDVMTPGVVSLVEDASLKQLYRALTAHEVHAVLVIGRTTGRPLGWATTRGLLAWVGRDESMAFARDAITEEPRTIEPGAPAREALTAISQAGTTRLLVCHAPDRFPEGVVTDSDLVAFAAR